MSCPEERLTEDSRSGALRAGAIGAAAGLAAGLLGIGGGLVMVPLLSLWIGVPIHRAVGTSLLGVLAIATTGVAAELVVAPSNVRWLPAALLASGAVAGSFVGARVVARTAPKALARALAVLLIVAAAKMAGVFPWLAAEASGEGAARGLDATAVGLHLLAGLAAGVVSALFGVGGGILAVPLLGLLHPDWSFHAARATSLAMIVPTAAAGAIFHRKLENVDGHRAAGLVPGALAGVVAGVVVANAVPGRPLEIAFAALLVVAAVRLVRRAAR